MELQVGLLIDYHWHRNNLRLVNFQRGNDHLGLFGIGSRKGFGTVPKRLLREPLRHSHRLCPFGPGVTVAVHGNAGDSYRPQPLAKHLGAVALFDPSNAREQRAKLRQRLQHAGSLRAECDYHLQAGFTPLVRYGSVFPVKKLIIRPEFRVVLALDDPLVFIGGDSSSYLNTGSGRAAIANGWHRRPRGRNFSAFG